MVSLVLADPRVMLWGGEPITLGGEVVGHTTSATYGPTLGASVALGYVKQFVKGADYAILNAGESCQARVTLSSPFDPRRERILC